jgi:hypothetical protein
MSLKNTLLVTALTVSTIAAVAGAQWYEKQNLELTLRPEAFETQQQLAVEPSNIGLRASISYASLEQSLNDLAPTTFRDQGADSWHHQTWIRVGPLRTHGPRLSVGYRWDARAMRSGPITVGPNGDRLRIAIPISFHGNAGLRGDGARLLALHAKNFDGSLTAFIDVSFDLDANWCPVANFDVSHRWNSRARFEIIDGVHVSVSGIVDDAIAEQVDALQGVIADELECDTIRGLVAPYWRSWSVPIAGSEYFGLGDDVEAFFNVAPQSIAFSGLTVDQDAVGIAVNLVADTALESAQIEVERRELPELQTAEWAPGQINLNLPVTVSLDDIETVAREALVEEVFASDTPMGATSIVVRDVEVFQSGDRLVIGADIVVDAETHFFSTSGTVYLSAVPVFDPENNQVRLEQVSFSRELDNELWNSLSAVFEGQIVSAISEYAVYDLTDDIARAEAAAFDLLSAPNLLEGLALSVQSVSVSASAPVLSEGNLRIALHANSAVDATLLPGALVPIQ